MNPQMNPQITPKSQPNPQLNPQITPQLLSQMNAHMIHMNSQMNPQNPQVIPQVNPQVNLQVNPQASPQNLHPQMSPKSQMNPQMSPQSQMNMQRNIQQAAQMNMQMKQANTPAQMQQMQRQLQVQHIHQMQLLQAQAQMQAKSGISNNLQAQVPSQVAQMQIAKIASQITGSTPVNQQFANQMATQIVSQMQFPRSNPQASQNHTPTAAQNQSSVNQSSVNHQNSVSVHNKTGSQGSHTPVVSPPNVPPVASVPAPVTISRYTDAEKTSLFKAMLLFQKSHVLKLVCLKQLAEEVVPVCCHPLSATASQSSRSLLFALTSTNQIRRVDSINSTYVPLDKKSKYEKKQSMITSFENHVVNERDIHTALEEAKAKFETIPEISNAKPSIENIDLTQRRPSLKVAPAASEPKRKTSIVADVDLDAEQSSLNTTMTVSTKVTEIFDVESILSRFNTFCSQLDSSVSVDSNLGSMLNITLSAYLRDVASHLVRISQHRTEVSKIGIDSYVTSEPKKILLNIESKENSSSNPFLKRKSENNNKESKKAKTSDFDISKSLTTSEATPLRARQTVITLSDCLFYLESPGVEYRNEIYTQALNSLSSIN